MELNRIHNCTAIDLLTSLDEQAALIIADPPYGIGYRSAHDTKFSGKGIKYEDEAPREHKPDNFADSDIDTSWLKSAFDALKDEGAMYLFTRWDVLHHWHTAAQEAGFKVAQRIIWDKAHWGAGNLDYFGSQIEDILFCVKGKHTLGWEKREGNVWRIARGVMLVQDGGGKHPTQKPTRLMSRIITYSSKVGELVVDPFSGSGAACIAAQRMHRRFIGCDISPDFAAAAQAWVEQTAPHTLPMF
jgi:site-specific DNA-methyltransferase (adenine-specific)